MNDIQMLGFRTSPQQHRVAALLAASDAAETYHRIEIELEHPLDVKRLLEAVQSLRRQHEILRTRVVMMPDQPPIQLIDDELLQSPDPAPWDVSIDAEGIKIGIWMHVLNGDAHSIVRTAGLLSDEYLGHVHPSESISQYADLAEALHELLNDEQGVRYWQARAIGPESAGQPRARLVASNDCLCSSRFDLESVLRGVTVTHTKTDSPAETRREGLIFALWAMFVSKLCQQPNVCLGYVEPGSEALAGLLSSGPVARTLLLPLILDWSKSVAALSHEIYGQWLEDRGNAPFYDPAGAVSVTTSPAFLFESIANLGPEFAGTRVVGSSLRSVEESFGLKLGVSARYAVLMADPRTYSKDRFAGIVTNFQRWLDFISARGDVPVGAFSWSDLLVANAAAAARGSNASRRPSERPLVDVREAVRRWAADRPQFCAVSDALGTMTYQELDARIDTIASRLHHIGLEPRQTVAIHLARSHEWVTYWLASWQLNLTVLPLSVLEPAHRVAQLAARGGAAVVISRELPGAGFDGRVIPPFSKHELRDVPGSHRQHLRQPADIAYTLFTSGSTGRPKGVSVSHAALSNYLQWAQLKYSGGGGGGTIVHSELTFDFTQTSLWVPLLAGETLHILMQGAALAELMSMLGQHSSLTFLKLTPAHLQGMRALDQTMKPRRWPRHLVIGGSALSGVMLPESLIRSDSLVHNEYGPTEATVGCTVFSAVAAALPSSSVPIGAPCDGNRVWVLDSYFNILPVGATGEIYIDGEQLAAGYLGDARETARCFLPHPVAGHEGSRLYRTGDMARWLSPGVLDYLGRTDSQVKLRGHRIELEEINRQLLQHPRVSAAHTTIARGATDGSTTAIISFVTMTPTDAAALDSWLRSRLPSYMIPSQVITIDGLPMTAHGKVDVDRLLDLRKAQLEQPASSTPSQQEGVLASIWQDVLRIDAVGLDANFFNLGGDSIRSIQVVAAARARGIDISVEQIFDFPSIRSLAKVARFHRESLEIGSEPFSLLPAADCSSIPSGVVDAYPVAQLQLGMIYHHELETTRSLYHDIFSYRLRIDLDVNCLQYAARSLVARHPALRTTFDLTSYSEPLQIVWRDAPDILEYEDLTPLDRPSQASRLAEWIETEKLRGFDIGKLPLLRIKVHRLDGAFIQLTTSFHHAIMDGWSDQQLHTELFDQYAALRSGRAWHLSPPSTTYRDYVALERQELSSDAARQFWVRHLAGCDPLNLADVSSDAVTSRNFRTVRTKVPGDIARNLGSIASQLGVHLRTVLLAAHYRALAIVSGQSHVVSGMVSNCRLEREDGERCIGLFINSTPLALQTRGLRWDHLILELQKREREMHPHRRLPLAEIQRQAGRDKITDALFYFTSFHNGIRANAAMQSEERYGHEVSSFALVASFNVDPDSNEIVFSLMTDSGLISPERTDLLCALYSEALRVLSVNAATRTDAQTLLPAAMASVLRSPPRRSGDQEVTVVSMFEGQAQRAPQCVAVSAGNDARTYLQLNRAANRIAKRLLAVRVGAEDTVGIMLPRGCHMVTALLGVLKSGASFVMLDKDDPPQRLSLITSGCRFLIAEGAACFAESLPKGKVIDPAALGESELGDDENPHVRILPSQAAYKMYTSGTTGSPKCVVVEHRSYVNVLKHFQHSLAVAPGDTVFATSATSFDISLLEIGLPLIAGARLHVLMRDEVTDGEAFAEAIDRLNPTVVQATPSLWAILRNSSWRGSRALKALSGGEKLPRQLGLWLLDNAAEVWDLYGPTETTIWSAAKRINAREFTLGEPISATQCYVLDQDLQAAPRGTVGSLFIGGAGLARGYEGKPAMTAAVFLPDPFSTLPGQRMYSTGDQFRINSDAQLQFCGRTDRQVKVRGHRLELQEIEGWLESYGPVATALVVYGTDQSRDELIAYLVPKQVAAVTYADEAEIQRVGLGMGQLRDYLVGVLPTFAVPTRFQLIAKIPRTRNGKIDYSSLPRLSAHRPVLATPYRAPSTAIEYVLHELWSRVLKIDRVGVRDDFLELGGYSLSAIQIVFHLRKIFDVKVPVSAVFEALTIERMGDYLRRQFPDAHIDAKAEILMSIMQAPDPPIASTAP